jgi:N-glycosylase/DNA lyase
MHLPSLTVGLLKRAPYDQNVVARGQQGSQRNFVDRLTSGHLEFISLKRVRARDYEPVTIDRLRATHAARRKEIRTRLREFRQVWQTASDARLWEEMVYCIFTAGASARMGLRSVETLRPLLESGQRKEMTRALVAAGAHRFPNARPGYIVVTRDYLQKSFSMRLRERLDSFRDPFERRDWLAKEPRIKGLGYKEASHFLRNVGFKGYGILDKHIVRCLAELDVIDSPKPPTTRNRYLEAEARMRQFAEDAEIDFDELDLVLWSMKTGEILK